MQHIHSESHKIKIRQSPYNDYILELINTAELEHRLELLDEDQTES